MVISIHVQEKFQHLPFRGFIRVTPWGPLTRNLLLLQGIEFKLSNNESERDSNLSFLQPVRGIWWWGSGWLCLGAVRAWGNRRVSGCWSNPSCVAADIETSSNIITFNGLGVITFNVIMFNRLNNLAFNGRSVGPLSLWRVTGGWAWTLGGWFPSDPVNEVILINFSPSSTTGLSSSLSGLELSLEPTTTGLNSEKLILWWS